MEEEISLVELFGILRKRIGMIIGLSLLGLIASFVMTYFVLEPNYSSKAQMLVSQAESSENVQQGDINANLQLINTYKDVIKGPVILDDVREELDLDLTNKQLAGKIEVSTESDSQVFSIEVTTESPYQAAEIANTTAETFQENIYEIMNVDNVTIISEGIVDTDPVSPNKPLNLAIGLLLGLMTGIGLTFVLEFLDMTVKDEKFITEELGWTNLGSIVEMTDEELKMKEEVPERENGRLSRRSRV